MQIVDLFSNIFRIAFGSLFLYPVVIIWGDNLSTSVLVEELTIAFRITFDKLSIANVLASQMGFDKLVSEGQLIEHKLTDLIVSKISLETMLDVLKIRDRLHFA